MHRHMEVTDTVYGSSDQRAVRSNDHKGWCEERTAVVFFASWNQGLRSISEWHSDSLSSTQQTPLKSAISVDQTVAEAPPRQKLTDDCCRNSKPAHCGN